MRKSDFDLKFYTVLLVLSFDNRAFTFTAEIFLSVTRLEKDHANFISFFINDNTQNNLIEL